MTTAITQEIDECFHGLLSSGTLPAFDAGAMADALHTEFETIWPLISEESRAVVMGVAVILKRRHVDGVMADLHAEQTIKRMSADTNNKGNKS